MNKRTSLPVMARTYIKNKSLRWKIVTSVVCALLVMSTAFIFLLRIDQYAMQELGDSYVSNAELNSFLQNVTMTESSLELYVDYRTFESIDMYYTYSLKLNAYRMELQANPSTDPISQKSYVVNQLTLSFGEFSNKVIVARRSNNIDLLNEYYPKTIACYKMLIDQVSELDNLLLQKNASAYMAERRIVFIINKVCVVFFILLFLTVTFMLYVLITSITKPLADISEVALRLAGRDFDVPLFNRDTHDEIGNICRAFDRMIISIRDYIDTIWQKARTENELREKEIEMRALYSDAQLRALQSQINPHFLFNTLNTGVQLAMMEGADKTSYFIEQVADFFRYNIQQQKQTATIDEELGLVDNFVYIMKVRFGKRLEFTKSVPDIAFAEVLPTMTLQPLVENCIKHGLRNSTGHVELNVSRQENYVQISVSDNGCGFDSAVRTQILSSVRNGDVSLAGSINRFMADSALGTNNLEEHENHTGIGLMNVFLRLKLYFHRDDVFDICANPAGTGTTFIIRVPIDV